MVGQAVTRYWQSVGIDVLAYPHSGLDITDKDEVFAAVESSQPDAVINCAAWTDVDGCEFDPARAFKINAGGPENLARASRKTQCRFLTISTDYVFDGTKEGFYTQRDDPNPQSVYAESKLDGERQAQVAYARTIVVRTGFIFGSGGKNFLSTVVTKAPSGHRIRAIADAWGTPTYARDLAKRLLELVQLDIPGVYHVVNSGEGASYLDFAEAVFEDANFDLANLEAIASDSLNRPAARPINSRLKCVISEALGLSSLPSWRAALQDFVTSQGFQDDARK